MLEECREIKAIFQRKATFGAIVRVAFDGEEPALLAEQLAELTCEGYSNHRFDPDDDFYPDEIPEGEWLT
jgi:hypothetical protein